MGDAAMSVVNISEVPRLKEILPEETVQAVRDLLASVESGKAAGIAFVAVQLDGDVTSCWGHTANCNLFALVGAISRIHYRVGGTIT